MNKQLKDLTLYTAHFIDELIQSGVECAVISPGSRSTPMALLMAEHPDLTTYLQIDERSAGFFALGLAKASNKSVALLCTSGTAAANYFPAIAEAKNARVPLIVLTSDRPHELREVGAPQAIDQNQMYGNAVKWFSEMALPDCEESMLRYVRSSAARAVFTSMQSPSGPVHLNFPFREPLIPDYDGIFERLDSSFQPIQLTSGKRKLPQEEMNEMAEHLKSVEKGIIVCGEIGANGFSKEVIRLSKALGYPILADPLSQLRSGVSDPSVVIDSYDALLKNEPLKQAAAFDVVLRFGAIPVSKPLTLYLKEHIGKEHIIIDESGGWRDPLGAATQMIAACEMTFCRDIADYLEGEPRNSEWLHKWQRLNETASLTMKQVKDAPEMDEGRVMYQIIEQIPEHSSLFVGNSMPIRDLDSFFFSTDKRLKVYANRGANGIDGLVSSALGAAAYDQQLYLVIGDLSFFHDLNGLLAAKLNGLKMTIIVVNNNGGGIFSYLPQSGHPKHFESLFGTPADLDFEHAAKLYNGEYCKVETADQLSSALVESVNSDRLFIIEAITDRMQNVVNHRDLWKKVSREIDGLTVGDDFWK